MRKAAPAQRACRRVALAGYTNVGKSTLLNALTGAEVSTANRLFETLDPSTRAYDYLGKRYLMTDTVGFIRKLPHQLVEAFASTLEETLLGDLLLHVADGSQPTRTSCARRSPPSRRCWARSTRSSCRACWCSTRSTAATR